MKAVFLSVIFLMNLSLPADSSETESELLVRSGRISWAAAVCATYAELSGDKKNQERYFLISLREGRSFFQGLSNNKILPKDASSNLPFIMYDSFSGPSDEFKLGSMYQIATRSAFDEIKVLEEKRKSEYPNYIKIRTPDEEKADRLNDIQKLYWRSNCSAIR